MLNKIRYICQSIYVNVNRVSRKYGGNRFIILGDMILSMIRYSASPSNYYYFGFPRLDHAQRKTYVTHELSEQIQKKYNWECIMVNKHYIFYEI